MTEEMLNKLIKGGESMMSVAGGTATELASEAINLFIVGSVLAILKVAVVFVLYFIARKFLNAIEEADGKPNNVVKAAKLLLLCSSLVFFTVKSFPHVEDLTKAMVAPNIFLAEKALEYAKK